MSEKIKKFAPYALPLLAILFVLFMFVRWYKAKTDANPEGMINSNLQVESLTQEQEESIIRGTTDYKTVALTSEGEASGELRYQMIDDKLFFTVTANLPDSQEAYAVWLKELDGSSKKRVFNLDYSKAGYIGSAAVPADILPVEVVVSEASDLMLEDAVLRGIIEVEE
jgi:hypothetical protein